ncbi:MAG: manganese/zinc/iron transport system substrate-binding protein [Flammeovirgaceae bacterium]|jgi:manganese/zinc/iron transport system substrate-binding protein
MRRHIFFVLILFFIVGCGQEDKGPDRFLVVATTSMIGDAMKAMLDTSVSVVSLMGPGTDPHLFKPTKQSLDYLAEADLIVANGLHLEGRMQDILEKMSMNKPVIFLGAVLSDDELILPDGTVDYPDPHIWFDVRLWKNVLEASRVELAKLEILDSSKSEEYLTELEELHLTTKSQIDQIPLRNKVLLTAHDAFSYFGRAYGIRVIGLQGISTAAEYGLKDVEMMVDLIATQKIGAVFMESSISSRSMEAVISGVRQKGGEVKLGGTLYSDAPGPEGSGAETYMKMVRHNVETITTALK